MLVVTFLHGEKNSHKDAPAGKRADAKSIAAQTISAIQPSNGRALHGLAAAQQK